MEAGALTCSGGSRSRSTEQRRAVKPRGSLSGGQSRVSEGRVGRGAVGRQRSCASPTAASRRGTAAPGEEPGEKQVVDRPEAGSARRQACGRRRLDDQAGNRGMVRRRSKPGESRGAESGLRIERRRVSHGARGQSPKRVFPTGARGVNVGCRSGFEASCRYVRGTPRGDTRA